mmetsp:Transcript_71000/g.148007  ORF Transcript_71000/g.148007 Transcript_71000/m.148007 type:complete len:202 (+) Transcript_71000:1574-2179(+)
MLPRQRSLPLAQALSLQGTRLLRPLRLLLPRPQRGGTGLEGAADERSLQCARGRRALGQRSVSPDGAVRQERGRWGGAPGPSHLPLSGFRGGMGRHCPGGRLRPLRVPARPGRGAWRGGGAAGAERREGACACAAGGGCVLRGHAVSALRAGRALPTRVQGRRRHLPHTRGLHRGRLPRRPPSQPARRPASEAGAGPAASG